MSILQLERITKSFDRQVLADISFSVNRGEIFGLLGESGSGKSTLLRIAAGLIDADNGRVLFKNKPILTASEKLIAGHDEIKIVHQDAELFPQFTVYENISYALRFYEKDYQRERTQELMELCRLDHVENRKTTTLSGGERQRTAIARALAEKAKVLLLDEPFAHLDLPNRSRIINVIQRLVARTGLACVFVTHDAPSALALSSKLGILQTGTLIQIDTPQNIYYRPSNSYAARLSGDVNLLKNSYLKAVFNVVAATVFENNVTAIRPEQFELCIDKSPKAVEAVVCHIQFWGNQYKIQILCQKQKIWVFSPVAYNIGATIFVKLG